MRSHGPPKCSQARSSHSIKWNYCKSTPCHRRRCLDLLNLGFRRTRSRQYSRGCCRIADERGSPVDPLQRLKGTRGIRGTERRPRRRPDVQGRATSNGCTCSPPAIRGFDGSKRSRTSRFLTSERATTKASFRLVACRSATLKKALPK